MASVMATIVPDQPGVDDGFYVMKIAELHSAAPREHGFVTNRECRSIGTRRNGDLGRDNCFDAFKKIKTQGAEQY